jgi:hypothetical protein
MATFCQQFCKRSPSASPVRTRCKASDNGQRLEITFYFNSEVVQRTAWSSGDLIDLDKPNGRSLILKRFPTGRTLHGKPPFVQFSFSKEELERVNTFIGFNVLNPHFWEHYEVQGDSLVLSLKEIDQPVPD